MALEEQLQLFPFKRSEPQIMALHELCNLWQVVDKFWAFDDVLAAISKPGSLAFFAAESEAAPHWQGVILADVGPYSTDLLYLYVKAEARRHGLGRALLDRLVVELQKRPQTEALFLEVRESNKGAQKLYESLNMRIVGHRMQYYANGENALVYKLEFKAGPDLCR